MTFAAGTCCSSQPNAVKATHEPNNTRYPSANQPSAEGEKCENEPAHAAINDSTVPATNISQPVATSGVTLSTTRFEYSEPLVQQSVAASNANSPYASLLPPALSLGQSNTLSPTSPSTTPAHPIAGKRSPRGNSEPRMAIHNGVVAT